MARLRATFDRLLPGRVDGLAAVLAFLCCQLSTWPWFLSPDVIDGNAPVSVIELAMAAAAGTLGVSLGALSLIGLWLILGNESVWHRFLLGLVTSLVPALILALTLQAALPPLETPRSVLNSIPCLVLAQRWLVVSCLVLVGIGLRAVTRWRLMIVTTGDDYPRKFPATIRSLVIITACVAVGIAIFQTLRGPVVEGMADNYWWSEALGLGIAEVATTTMFLTFPIVISFASRQLRRYLPLLLAVIGSIVTLGLVALTADREGKVISATTGVAYFSTLVIGACMARRWGFQLAHLTREQLWLPRRTGVSHRAIGWLLASLFVIPYLFAHSTADTRALLMALTSGNRKVTPWRAWKFATATRRINRLVGDRPEVVLSSSAGGRIPAFQWSGETWEYSISAMCEWASLDVNESSKQVETLKALSNIEFTDISITAPKVSTDLFAVLSKRKEIGLLRLKSDAIDPIAFASLCESTKIGMVCFDRVPSADVLKALRLAKDLNYVSVLDTWGVSDYMPYDTLHFPSAAASELASLPVTSLVISYEESQALELGELRKLRSLRVYSSPIDEEFVGAVNELPPTTRARLYVTLDRCDLNQDSVNALAELNVQRLSIQWDDSTEPPVNWMPLAKNSFLESVTIRAIQDRYVINQVQRAQFNVMAGRELLRNIDSESTWYVREFLENRERARNDAWKQIAHGFDLNEQGELEYLDLNWIPLDQALFNELADMPSLRRIRFGGPPGPRREVSSNQHLEVTNLFQKSNLEVIETPCLGPLTDKSLSTLAQLPSLKRLVLPICSAIPNPDQVPFPIDVLKDHQLRRMIPAKKQIDASAAPDYDPGLVVSHKGIQLLANNEQLESLVLPGSLLNDQTLSVFETLPKLKSLHLPFSRAKSEQINRVANLSLQELTIGVDEALASNAVRSIAESSSMALRVLQLFVYFDGDDVVSDARALRDQLEEMLPNTETHLLTVPLRARPGGSEGSNG